MFNLETLEVRRPYTAPGKHLVTVAECKTGETNSGNKYLEVYYHADDSSQVRQRYIFSEKSSPIQLSILLRQIIAARMCTINEAKELLGKVETIEDLSTRFQSAMEGQKFGVVVYNRVANGRVYGNLDENQFVPVKNFASLHYDERKNQVPHTSPTNLDRLELESTELDVLIS